MDKQQAFYSLWSRFNLPAYDENRVPEDAVYPYVTYQVLLDEKEISEYIEDMLPIPLDEGYMNITKGEPFAQRTSDPNDKTVIGYMLNLGVEFLTRI